MKSSYIYPSPDLVKWAKRRLKHWQKLTQAFGAFTIIFILSTAWYGLTDNSPVAITVIGIILTAFFACLALVAADHCDKLNDIIIKGPH